MTLRIFLSFIIFRINVNDVEIILTWTKDQYGQDYGGKIMKTLPILDRYKNEIAFGDQYRERIKLKS